MWFCQLWSPIEGVDDEFSGLPLSICLPFQDPDPRQDLLCGFNCISGRELVSWSTAFMPLERDWADPIGAPLATGGLMMLLSIYVTLVVLFIIHSLQGPWEVGDHCYLQSSVRWNDLLRVIQEAESQLHVLSSLGDVYRHHEQFISRSRGVQTQAKNKNSATLPPPIYYPKQSLPKDKNREKLHRKCMEGVILPIQPAFTSQRKPVWLAVSALSS